MIEGVYTIRSDSLGTLRIEASKVKTIQPRSAPTLRDEEIQRLQEQIMGNQEVLNMILSLQDDPDVQKALQDPAVMDVIQKKDIESLMSNKTFLDLLNHPKIQGIGKKVLK